MNPNTNPRCCARIASAVAALAIAVSASVLLASPAGASPATASASPTCTTGAAPVLFEGQWYCPGFVVGVKRGAYGVNEHIVLQSVTVLGVTGTAATVEGGPSCLTPTTFCGATIPSVRVWMTALSSRPARGDIIDVNGITGTNALTATGYVVNGTSSCSDPDFC